MGSGFGDEVISRAPPSASWEDNPSVVPAYASARLNLSGFGDEGINRAPPPTSPYVQIPTMRSGDRDFGRVDRSMNRGTFITQSLSGTQFGPLDDSEPSSVFKHSARQPVHQRASTGVARTVKVNLDDD